MASPVHRVQKSLPHLDGFRVEMSEENSRADIILDRPPPNLVSMRQGEQLCSVFELLDEDPKVRVIVVSGAGDHFSNGADTTKPTDDSLQYLSRLSWNMSAPWRCSKPVICASRGNCFGASFELSLACDFRIATETTLYSLFAQTEWGRPESGGSASAQLLKTLGPGRTRNMVMRARLIGGAEAYEWGIATEFAVDSELESATDALVCELLAVSPIALSAAKRSLNNIEEVRQLRASESNVQSYGCLASSVEVQPRAISSAANLDAPQIA